MKQEQLVVGDDLVYPAELCDVRVMIGDRSAGLLYVSSQLVNFKVPMDTPEESSVALRVVHNGVSSAPLTLSVALEEVPHDGFETAKVELDQPAYVGMPVWLKVRRADGNPEGYPFVMGTGWYGCNSVEVRRDGKLLPMITGSNRMANGGVGAGNACAGFAVIGNTPVHSRLPLHLLYHFDQPGTYEVRYLQLTGPLGMGGQVQVRSRSPWTPINVLPAMPNGRTEWLNSLRRRAPSDPMDLLTDALPSLLGFPDELSLDILTGYLYDPQRAVRMFASNGLSFWSDKDVSPKLLALLKMKGPTDFVVRSFGREFRETHADEIAEASLPYLTSDSTVAVEGAIDALTPLLGQRPEFADAVFRAAEQIMPRLSQQYQAGVASMVVATKDPRAHGVLMKLLQEGYAAQVVQRLIALADPQDLPMFGEMLLRSGESWTGGMPQPLRINYGAAAVPYLEAALRGAPDRYEAANLTRELMAAGSAAGFQFALQALEKNGFILTRRDVLQMVREQFRELWSSDDDTVVAFVKQRAGRP
jgi:hypothetical protein